MAYREVVVVEIAEILRLWLRGCGFKRVAKFTGADRKTVRRYVGLARELGVKRSGGEGQITEELIGSLVAFLQPGRVGERGDSWRACENNRKEIEKWLDEDKLKLTKVLDLLKRRGAIDIPYRTLHRFAVEELGFGKKRTTVRLDDCQPGQELQLDFGFMGYIKEASGKRRKVWALIFTAVYSRHQFVYFTYRQAFEWVIRGFELAWEFFGGIFDVVIPDNIKAIVASSDALNPKFTEGYVDYMQARGFVTDPARIRHPKDKARVERAVPYVRNSCFAGENFADIEKANDHALSWCLKTAGMRDHGTTHCQPLVVFETEEKPALKPAPTEVYDIPQFGDVKVHNDQHIVICKALYSVPLSYVGEGVHVRVDSQLVRIFYRRKLIKVHPRQLEGGRSSDPEDFPEDKVIYATRDTETLCRRAEAAGPHVAEYATRLLENAESWGTMRALFRLLGLAHRYGNHHVDKACELSLSFDVVDVKRIERMVRQGLEKEPPETPPSGSVNVVNLRFARPVSHFAVSARSSHNEGGDNDHQ